MGSEMCIRDRCYSALCEQWLSQTRTLDFLKGSNPWVLRDMAERLLEASNRGLWTSASGKQLLHLQQLVNNSEAQIERGGPIC